MSVLHLLLPFLTPCLNHPRWGRVSEKLRRTGWCSTYLVLINSVLGLEHGRKGQESQRCRVDQGCDISVTPAELPGGRERWVNSRASFTPQPLSNCRALLMINVYCCCGSCWTGTPKLHEHVWLPIHTIFLWCSSARYPTLIDECNALPWPQENAALVSAELSWRRYAKMFSSQNARWFFWCLGENL